MSEYNIQMNKYNALNAEYDQLYPQPMKHASTHAKDGDDPITPSSIGAAELGADGKVPESQLPSMGFHPNIIVTAPTGSTVTCSNGTTVLTAQEIEGTWTFDVPDYGTWTVKNESKHTTVDVVVDAVKQYLVDASPYEQLVNYTVLYDYDDECADVTGGWNKTYGSDITVSRNTDNIAITDSGADGNPSICFTRNKLNLDGYVMGFAKMSYTKLSGSYGTTSTNHSAFLTSETNSDFSDNYEAEMIVKLGNKQGTAQDVYLFNTNTISLGNVERYFALAAYYAINRTMFCGIVKSDDWATLASKAGISASSIDDVLANSATLLANEDAVEFMIRQCTGDFMASAVASSIFLTALESSPYRENVYANEHWAKFLAMVA